MSGLPKYLETIDVRHDRSKQELVEELRTIAEENGYTVAEVDATRPWGAFLRFENTNGDQFVADFFEGLDPTDARLGNDEAELSPKLLLVSPEQRLSWQYHHRRAERWKFLNEGGYVKSTTDEQSEVHQAQAGEVVQFETGERHRLVGSPERYTLVAEIWQHTDSSKLSNEEDIVRLEDDYRR